MEQSVVEDIILTDHKKKYIMADIWGNMPPYIIDRLYPFCIIKKKVTKLPTVICTAKWFHFDHPQGKMPNRPRYYEDYLENNYHHLVFDGFEMDETVYYRLNIHGFSIRHRINW